jgi:hypothetical protein
MFIEIYGTLYFENGQKISLDENGMVNIYFGGLVNGANGGSKIVVDGVSMWDGNDADIVGPSSIDINGLDTSGLLPITLIDFSVNNTHNINKLTWTTSSEINNDYFIVESSVDGFIWDHVGITNGSGNSNVNVNYSYGDDTYKDVINYYRLTQVDYDGKFETFNTISVNNIRHSKSVERVDYYNTMGQLLFTTNNPRVVYMYYGLLLIKTTYKGGNINIEKRLPTCCQ